MVKILIIIPRAGGHFSDSPSEADITTWSEINARLLEFGRVSEELSVFAYFLPVQSRCKLYRTM